LNRFIQIRELNRQLESRDELIGELRAANDASKDTAARQSALILTLRQHVIDSDAQRGNLEGVAGRNELALANLQRECQSAQEQIVKLETELRSDLFMFHMNPQCSRSHITKF
jgi:chromosome segregation ATPase